MPPPSSPLAQLAQLALFSPAAEPDAKPTPKSNGANPKAEAQDKAQTLHRIRAMSQVLPEIPFMLCCLLMLQASGWLNANQLHYFQGPVIFGKTDWNGTLPDDMTRRLIEAVRLERFWLLLEEAESGRETQQCVPAEVVCALQPYTLMGPLPYEEANALIWAFETMLTQHPTLFCAAQSYFDTKQAQTPKPDKYTLQNLGIKIRRKVINAAPKARKASPAPEPEPVVELEPQTVQYQLF